MNTPKAPYLVRITGGTRYAGRFALITEGPNGRFLTLFSEESGYLEEDSTPVDALTAWDWEGAALDDLPGFMQHEAAYQLET